MVTDSSALLFVTTTKSAVRCNHDTQCPTGLSYRIIAEHTHREHRNMLHTIGASNSRSDCYTVFGTTLSGRSHPDANDSRCLHVNSGRPRNVRASVNKDGKTAALGQQQCKSQAKSHGKSDCPGQGCPKYFVLVSWIQIYIIYSYLLCLHFSFINRFKNSLIHTIVISFTNSSFLYFRPSVRPY